MKYYAKSKEDVINYLEANYGISFGISERIFLKNGMIAQFSRLDCACGESYGCCIEDGTEIVICEACYEEADWQI